MNAELENVLKQVKRLADLLGPTTQVKLENGDSAGVRKHAHKLLTMEAESFLRMDDYEFDLDRLRRKLKTLRELIDSNKCPSLRRPQGVTTGGRGAKQQLIKRAKELCALVMESLWDEVADESVKSDARAKKRFLSAAVGICAEQASTATITTSLERDKLPVLLDAGTKTGIIIVNRRHSTIAIASAVGVRFAPDVHSSSEQANAEF